jgi:hypothetical protein
VSTNSKSLLETARQILAKEDRFKISDLVVLIAFDCVGIPLCIAGAENAVHFDWTPTLVGFGVGIPLSLFGTIFPFIGVGPMKIAIRNWMQDYTYIVMPIAVAAAFIYVVGPDIYRRTIKPLPYSIGFTQQQVDAQIAKAIANLNSELTQANDQREAARREINVLRQQIHNTLPPTRNSDSPRVYTDKTVDTLRAPCEGHTWLQCDVLIADEKGKWIKLNGIASLIQPGGQVQLSAGEKKRAVICSFGPEWIAKLTALHDGDAMSVTGKINGYNGNFLILSKCELRD